MYKRVLLKLSGEQLAGRLEGGFDVEVAEYLAQEVKKAKKAGCQIAIMVGGGNFVRGEQIAGHGIKRVTGDHMGMLATMINGLALTDIFEANGIPTRCLSNIVSTQVAEQFVHRLADKYLEAGRVVIVTGGIGRPYLTTDTGAVSLALELDCEAVLKATKVDGVYDQDPTKFKNAKKLTKLSHHEAIENDSIMIMDKAAMGLAMQHHMSIIVFDASKPDNLDKVIQGEDIGTKIGG